MSPSSLLTVGWYRQRTPSWTPIALIPKIRNQPFQPLIVIQEPLQRVHLHANTNTNTHVHYVDCLLAWTLRKTNLLHLGRFRHIAKARPSCHVRKNTPLASYIHGSRHSVSQRILLDINPRKLTNHRKNIILQGPLPRLPSATGRILLCIPLLNYANSRPNERRDISGTFLEGSQRLWNRIFIHCEAVKLLNT
jgi:hypothetical protein